MVVTLTHHDRHSLVSSIIEYEKNDGKFNLFSNRVTSHWMHIKADIDVIVDLVTQPWTTTDSPIRHYIRDGVHFKNAKNDIDYGYRSLIITSDLFEAVQYSTAMPKGIKHDLIKAKRKHAPKHSIIIVPKQLAPSIMKWYSFHRNVFPFEYQWRGEVFDKCKFAYSVTAFYVMRDWQTYQTFILLREFHRPRITYRKCCKNYHRFPASAVRETDTFTCPQCFVHHDTVLRLECGHNVCKKCVKLAKRCPVCLHVILKLFVESCSLVRQTTVDEHLLEYKENVTASYVAFDDRSCNDFRKEYVQRQRCCNDTAAIHVSQKELPLFLDAKALDHIVIINSLSHISSTFAKSLHRSCLQKTLNIHVVYTDKKFLDYWSQTFY